MNINNGLRPNNNSYMPQSNSGIQWVNGETGAKSMMLLPNSTILLMDADNPRFYIKTTDSMGMPSIRTFEYTEVQQAPQGAQTAVNTEQADNTYIKDELSRISAKCDALEQLVKELTKPKKIVKKEEVEDE